jgi:hypothetical protein
VNHNVCNRLQTLIDCCNDPNDPNQFGGSCAAYFPPKSCAQDSECPERLNSSCTGLQLPYLCCTGAGTGTCSNDGCTGLHTPYNCCTGVNAGDCEAANITSQCTGSGVPFACCTGAGTGSGASCSNTTAGNGGINCLGAGNPLSCCTGLNTGPSCDITPITDQIVGISSTCGTKCPANPPICGVNESVSPPIHNFSGTSIQPCAGKVCSNNNVRACNVDADCVTPGTCTGTQQAGACAGESICVPQAGPGGVTGCQVIDPVNALGQVIDNSQCTGSGTPYTCCSGAGTGTCSVTCTVTVL